MQKNYIINDILTIEIIYIISSFLVLILLMDYSNILFRKNSNFTIIYDIINNNSVFII